MESQGGARGGRRGRRGREHPRIGMPSSMFRGRGNGRGRGRGGGGLGSLSGGKNRPSGQTHSGGDIGCSVGDPNNVVLPWSNGEALPLTLPFVPKNGTRLLCAAAVAQCASC